MTGEEEPSDGAEDPSEEAGGLPTGGPLVGLAGSTIETVLAVYRIARETQITFLAAAVAYYAFVSMVPLVVIGIVVATVLGGDALADRLVAAAAEVLTPSGEELVRTAVTDREGLGSVTVAGVAVLLWGALKAFRALDRAFTLVYGDRPTETLLQSIADAALALAAVGAGVASMIFIGTVVAVLPGGFPGSLGAVALFLTLFVVFLPLFFLFPDVDLAVREVVAGAVLAAVGWTVLGSVFQLYATYVSGVSVYGFLGAVLLVLAWLYVGALILMLGAALNAVRSGHAPVVAGE